MTKPVLAPGLQSDGLTEKREQLAALTSLRFFAASGIVIWHLNGHFGLPSDLSFGGWLPYYKGVGLFFVLSGFILTWVHPSLPAWKDKKHFMIARVARIWPVHFFTLLLWFFTMLFLTHKEIGAMISSRTLPPLLANILMVQAWVPASAYYSSGNAVAWSISTEFGFYLLFLFLIRSIERTWHIKIIGALLLAGILIAIVTWLKLPYESPDGVTMNGVIYMSPLARLYEFACGMGAACLFKKYRSRMEGGTRGASLIEVCSLVLVLSSALLTMPAPLHWISMGKTLPAAFELWLRASAGIEAVPISIFIMVMACQKGLLSRAISWRGFVLLGEASYSIYLVHYLLLQIFYMTVEPMAIPELSKLALYLACLLPLALLIWRFVEVPSRRWLMECFIEKRGPCFGVQT